MTRLREWLAWLPLNLACAPIAAADLVSRARERGTKAERAVVTAAEHITAGAAR